MEIIRWITSSNTLPGGNGPWLHLVAILYLSVTLVAKPVEEIQLNEAAFYGTVYFINFIVLTLNTSLIRFRH